MSSCVNLDLLLVKPKLGNVLKSSRTAIEQTLVLPYQ